MRYGKSFILNREYKKEMNNTEKRLRDKNACLRYDVQRLRQELKIARRMNHKDFQARVNAENQYYEALRAIAFFFTPAPGCAMPVDYPAGTVEPAQKSWNEKLRRLKRILLRAKTNVGERDMSAYKKVCIAHAWIEKAYPLLNTLMIIAEQEKMGDLALKIKDLIVWCPNLRSKDDITPGWKMPADWDFTEDWDSETWKKNILESNRKHYLLTQKYGFTECPVCKTVHSRHTLTCRNCNHQVNIDKAQKKKESS